jgi:hypothetical protein
MSVIAGIGSRKTPFHILSEMREIGAWCRESSIWVRSGHAEGADYAFEEGAQEYCIAYLPWTGFNNKLARTKAHFCLPLEQMFSQYSKLIKKYHPASDKLSSGALKLMKRNCCQVLGNKLDSPVFAVICWTPQSLSSMGMPEWKGGTGFACRMAFDYTIPILNMYEEKWNNAENVIKRLKDLESTSTL